MLQFRLKHVFVATAIIAVLASMLVGHMDGSAKSV